jgi:enterochelin esterase family protein
VSFVYVGEAEDVAIVGSMTGDVRAEPLERLEGTDVFLRTFAIEPGARFEYSLQIDFGEPVPDPRNPRTCETPFGRASEVVTPGYEVPAHVAAPTGPAGRVETVEYTSEMLGNTRELSIYLPAGYDEGTEPLPLLLLHDGPHWIRLGGLPRALDHLIAAGRVPPLVAVAIAPLDRWWFESGGSRTEEYLAMLATELVPYLGERYRLTDDPAHRALTGVRGFGLTSVFGVVAHPDVFGRAGAQSPFLGDVARHAFFEELAADAPENARFYVDWNRYEEVDPDLGVDFGADARALRSALETAGCDVSGGEVLDCHGWKSWSARLDAMLVALFGG